MSVLLPEDSQYVDNLLNVLLKTHIYDFIEIKEGNRYEGVILILRGFRNRYIFIRLVNIKHQYIQTK